MVWKKCLTLWIDQIWKNLSCFFKSKQKTNSKNKKEKIKSIISQHFGKFETEKLLTKSKPEYFSKIFGADKIYKKTQASKRKRERKRGVS